MTVEHLIVIILVYALWDRICSARVDKENAKFWREQAEHDFNRYMDLANKMFDEDGL